MSKKNKYDVMKNEMKDFNKYAISLVFQLFSWKRKIKKGKITDEELSLEVISNLDKLIPFLEIISHIFYENFKDIENIDKNELFESLKSKKINPMVFVNNYNKNKEVFTKILLFFALIDKFNITLPKFDNPELAMDLLSNFGDFDDFIYKILDDYDPNVIFDVYSALSDFDVTSPEDENYELIENFHNKYMNRNINPYVTISEIPNKEVIKLARTIGKNKNQTKK